MNTDVIAYIQQLEQELKETQDQRDGLSIMLTNAQSAFETVKRERDAAVEELRGVCRLCNKYNDHIYINCNHLGTCVHVNMGEGVDHWQWRGVQEV